MTNLADHLRALPDDALAALLRLRPDLVVPVPSDLSALAVRAQSRVSVARALDGLDRFTLQVLDAARLSPRRTTALTSVDAIVALAVAVEPTAVRAALDRLRARFLLYGPPTELRLVGGVDEVSSPYPAGLGRPAADLDARAAALVRGPGAAAPHRAGRAARRPARCSTGSPPARRSARSAGDGADSPVRWLVDNAAAGRRCPAVASSCPARSGCCCAATPGRSARCEPAPPVPAAVAREPKAADSAGAGQAMEAVRHTETLLAALDAEPAAGAARRRRRRP